MTARTTKITATTTTAPITYTVMSVTSTERTSSRPLVLTELHRPLVTVILLSVLITNTMISVTDTDRTSAARAIVPGLHQQITTVTLLVHTTCTRIVDTAMGTKSTWEARADALVTDIAATVITSHVHFTNTLMLATYTAST